ncbi:hypothetical protein E3N88_41675 [Mikania micrantha]|uniref:Protein kinase domain-containing protein n=1 Tax=Mikania micrantha TaxID=192012 RepID=A0A5N6LJY9_9ASTR|nr:hypothetical protein E3N88_41675 [Mikania micrantha]
MRCCCWKRRRGKVTDGGATANNWKPAPPRGPLYGGGSIREPRNNGAATSGAPNKGSTIEAPSLSLDELNKITDNFGSESLIGEGSCCRIFYGKLSTGEEVVIKKLDLSTLSDSESDFKEKLAMISRLKNEYFSQLCGYCLEKKNRILVYQYATMGCLHEMLHGRKDGDGGGVVLNWNQRVKIAHGAARAKLADFSLNNLSSENAARLHSTRVLGTFGYHAPEYAMTGQITQKSDVYSFGVILLELLTGRNLWITHCLKDNRATPRLSEDKMAAVAALCVQYEADFRPSMTIVAKALQPLLSSKPTASES